MTGSTFLMVSPQTKETDMQLRAFQFSLTSLFGLTVLVALACTALLNATPLWSSTWFSLTIFVLLLGTLAAIFRQGSRRPFWIGFGLFGWVYLLLAFEPWADQYVAPVLLSTHGIAWLEASVGSEKGQGVISNVIVTGNSNSMIRLWKFSNSFLQIGHSVFALLFGLFGGMVAGWMSGTAKRVADDLA
jgi:hypothetical protein